MKNFLNSEKICSKTGEGNTVHTNGSRIYLSLQSWFSRGSVVNI
jgi:hypothetical protein